MPTFTKYTAKDFSNLFARKGVPANLIPVLVAQVQHETNNFKDAKLYTHNNASGIIYINKPQVQKNASKGNVLPETKNSSKPYYYAKFATLSDWANDFIRVLKKQPAKPIEATDIFDYAKRLKANGYFTDTLSNYYKRLLSFYKGNKDMIKPAVNITGLLVAGVVVYLLISGRKSK